MRFAMISVSMLSVLLSCAKDVRPISMEFRIAVKEPADGLEQMIMSGWGHQDTFYVRPTIELTRAEVIAAEVTMMDDHPAIALAFSEHGASIMSRVTEENVNRHLAIILDGSLVSAPAIRAKIEGGRAIINGDFTHEQAKELAARIAVR